MWAVAGRRTLRRPSIRSLENKPYYTKPFGELGSVSFVDPQPPMRDLYGLCSLRHQARHSPVDLVRESPMNRVR